MLSFLGDVERYLFHEGSNAYAYRCFGCHLAPGASSTYRFTLWAPHALEVSLVGDWNDWRPGVDAMEGAEDGIWQIEKSDLSEGALYKYAILTRHGEWRFKADPYAFYSELRPGTASRIYSLDGYKWHDDEWLAQRRRFEPYSQPISIYEMHLASWRGTMNYRALADELVPYLSKMGYTHVEFMPLAEHPFDASWGYQVMGYFSATARFGEPKDLMYLIDQLHQAGIGVIMDWVPAHFPRDEAGLRRFDGEPCYEHPDPLRGEHPQWGTMIFDYGRPEVRSFLLSSALIWLDVFHCDGLRADAVTSMLYLDYARENDVSPRNQFGGTENLEAISFLQKCSEIIFHDFPGTLFCAEESSSFPKVTHPVSAGGLGFNYKWNMGWMHDMLDYMSLDPFFRSKNHSRLTFSMFYAFSENYLLPLSHDEVVHGKKSLLDKMPGDIDAKFANLRVFLSYMFAHPGKKLMFMGAELGEFIEWRFDEPLEWFLLDYPHHKNLQRFVARLNGFYRAHPSLYEIEDSWDGFRWLNVEDADHSIISLARNTKGDAELLIGVFNFTPVLWETYRVGIPLPGHYEEIFSSVCDDDSADDAFANGDISSVESPWNHQAHSIVIKLPPFGGLFFSYRPFSKREQLTIDLAKVRTLCEQQQADVLRMEKEYRSLYTAMSIADDSTVPSEALSVSWRGNENIQQKLAADLLAARESLGIEQARRDALAADLAALPDEPPDK